MVHPTSHGPAQWKKESGFQLLIPIPEPEPQQLLLPRPILGQFLLAVLLRFREHSKLAVAAMQNAISSDIRGMFYQIRFLPEDRPFLRFLW